MSFTIPVWLLWVLGGIATALGVFALGFVLVCAAAGWALAGVLQRTVLRR
jgi:hypothetical protein